MKVHEEVVLYRSEMTDQELLSVVLEPVKGEDPEVLAASVLAKVRERLEATGTDMHPFAYLCSCGADELRELVPLGPANLRRFLAAAEIGFRASRSGVKRLEVNNPRAVYEFLRPRIAAAPLEQFWAVLLSAKNGVIGLERISAGTLTASLVHPREVFRPAIVRRAHAMILTHNHPSGDPTPSREDREITRRLVQAGRVIGIEVLDHVVVTLNGFVSFREKGILS